MATTLLIDEGRAGLEVLEEMRAGFVGSYDQHSPADLVAALLWLDQRMGVARPTDRVVVSGMTAVFLHAMGRVVAPADAAAIGDRLRQTLMEDDASDSAGIGGDSDAELDEALGALGRWFSFQFDDIAADGTPLTIHPILRGRELQMRVMTDDETMAAGFSAATVRADDGTVIVAPPGDGVGFR